MSDQKQPKQDPEVNTPESDPAPESSAVPASIRLDQFLQLCGVPTGGQAKVLIQGGEVSVNGEVETRRRRKLVPGDAVGLDGEIYEVASGEE